MSTFNSISDVLRAAQSHPYYAKVPALPLNSSLSTMTADNKESWWQELEKHLPLMAHVRRYSFGSSTETTLNPDITKQPLLHKDNLYKIVQRLLDDVRPENAFRHNSYISITGGGSGKNLPMIFLTDADENQSQRLSLSRLMKACKLVEPTDWFLNLHPSGFLYRALDLSSQNIEQAGGSVLCAGHLFPHEKSFQACIKYHVNAITGDSSHLLNFAHHVSTLLSSDRAKLKIRKVIYTCEMMPRSKRDYLTSVFGTVTIYSMFASAETGPWAVADLNDTAEAEDENSTKYLYDTRAMHVEVLSRNSETFMSKSDTAPPESDFQAEGEVGLLVLTSLQRLKNPLVRYISGDIGSINPLFESSYPQIEPSMRPHLKVLRLYGRDQRLSFKWGGEYFELDKLTKVMQTREWGILQWQVIIESNIDQEGSDSLELRLLRREDDATIGRDELITRFHDVFYLQELNEKLWKSVFLDDVNGFIQSETSSKVVPVIDKRH